SNELEREFAAARAERDHLVRDQAAREAAAREAALRDQQRKELDQARRLLDDERRRNQAALQMQQTIQQERDKGTFQRAFDEAQRALAAKNLELAKVKFEQAGKVYTTDAVRTGLRNVDAARAQSQAEAVAAQQKAKEQLKQADDASAKNKIAADLEKTLTDA